MKIGRKMDFDVISLESCGIYGRYLRVEYTEQFYIINTDDFSHDKCAEMLLDIFKRFRSFYLFFS